MLSSQFAAAVAKSWQRAFCIIFDLLTLAAVLDYNTVGVSVWRNMVALPASSFHSLRKTSLLFSQILGQIKYTKITLETEKESLASNLASEQYMQPLLVSPVKSHGWNPVRVSSAGTGFTVSAMQTDTRLVCGGWNDHFCLFSC